MSQTFSEETHRNLLSRIPTRTGHEISEYLRSLEDGPALLRFEEKVDYLRREHEELSSGYARALVHEFDLRRAARKRQ
jgi:hypothetical protein